MFGPTPLAEVQSNNLLDDQKGIVIIIDYVVQRNKEARCAMEDYKKLEQSYFPWEDVTEASFNVKAIVCLFGKEKLPWNIILHVLEGFSSASSPDFQSIFHYKESIQHVKYFFVLWEELVDVLHDLELKVWTLAVVIDCLIQSSFFNQLNSDNNFDEDNSIHDYAVYKACEK